MCKKELLKKYSKCIECGGAKIKFDYFENSYFIEYVSNKCVFCKERC